MPRSRPGIDDGMCWRSVRRILETFLAEHRRDLSHGSGRESDED